MRKQDRLCLPERRAEPQGRRSLYRQRANPRLRPGAHLYAYADGYRHAEGNSPAHIRSILTGNAVTVPLSGGKVMLGRWQHVFLAEFDGPRTRDVHIQVLKA